MQPLLRALRVTLLAGLVLSLAASCSASTEDSAGADGTSDAPRVPSLQPAAATTSNGDACSGGSECVSSNCVDGVCCATKCSGHCQACSALKKESGIDNGTCGPRKAGLPPKATGACQFIPANTCNSGFCNGAGACGLPVGSGCGSPACQANNTQLAQPTCGASGLCDAIKFTQCGAFLCDDSNLQCLTACSTSAHCQPGHYCRGTKCQLTADNGKPCSDDEQCTSGNCYQSGGKTSGICCDSDCSSACNSCFKDEQEGPNKQDGACKPTRSGDDPNNECTAATDPCKGLGNCSGNGSCETVSPNGTACGNTTGVCSVSGGVPTVSGEQCVGGACSAAGSISSCEGVSKCNAAGTGCLSNCADDGDCQTTHFCKGGSCLKRSGLGAPCGAGNECLLNFCADGYCCDAECTGTCEACDLPQDIGKCRPVNGEQPHGDRDPCPGPGTSNNPCSARVCDGEVRGSCEGFVGSETKCGEAYCTQDPFSSSYSPERGCNGDGQCSEPNESGCGAFACNDGCIKSCTEANAATDCVKHAKCVAGNCILTQACVNAETLSLGDGTTVSCAPYSCQAASCRDSCDSKEHCSGGAICDAKSRTCVSAGGSQTDPGDPGCGCQTPGRGSNPPWSLLLLAALAIWPLRRRLA